MSLLIDCSYCRTRLQLPTGATSIRCAICQAVTLVGEPRSLHAPAPASAPPPPTSTYIYLSPAPPTPPPVAGPGAGGGRKKALICGISYRNSPDELKGCINDAKFMRYLLINRFGFPQSSILMLTEEEIDPYRIPTKNNIRMALHWLVQGCQLGDSLVFHYSGHGSQKKNYTRYEVDGFDETILPLDFKTQGLIVDDEINATIVRPLPHGVKLHAFIDACHSGTILDLPYLCRMNRSGQYVWEDHRPPSGKWKGTSGGEVISFSGCDDDQTSADTSKLSNVASTGVMTFCFIQAIERGFGTTYGSILNSMRSTIRNTGSNSTVLGGGSVTKLLSMLLARDSSFGELKQEPQLTSNEIFDVYAKPFIL